MTVIPPTDKLCKRVSKKCSINITSSTSTTHFILKLAKSGFVEDTSRISRTYVIASRRHVIKQLHALLKWKKCPLHYENHDLSSIVTCVSRNENNLPKYVYYYAHILRFCQEHHTLYIRHHLKRHFTRTLSTKKRTGL